MKRVMTEKEIVVFDKLVLSLIKRGSNQASDIFEATKSKKPRNCRNWYGYVTNRLQYMKRQGWIRQSKANARIWEARTAKSV